MAALISLHLLPLAVCLIQKGVNPIAAAAAAAVVVVVVDLYSESRSVAYAHRP